MFKYSNIFYFISLYIKLDNRINYKVVKKILETFYLNLFNLIIYIIINIALLCRHYNKWSLSDEEYYKYSIKKFDHKKNNDGFFIFSIFHSIIQILLIFIYLLYYNRLNVFNYYAEKIKIGFLVPKAEINKEDDEERDKKEKGDGGDNDKIDNNKK